MQTPLHRGGQNRYLVFKFIENGTWLIFYNEFKKKSVGLFPDAGKKCNIDTCNGYKQEVTRNKTRKNTFTYVIPGCATEF